MEINQRAKYKTDDSAANILIICCVSFLSFYSTNLNLGLALLFIIIVFISLFFGYNRIVFNDFYLQIIRKFVFIDTLKYKRIEYSSILRVKIVRRNLQRKVAYVLIEYKSKLPFFLRYFFNHIIRFSKVEELDSILRVSKKLGVLVELEIDPEFPTEYNYIIERLR